MQISVTNDHKINVDEHYDVNEYQQLQQQDLKQKDGRLHHHQKKHQQLRSLEAFVVFLFTFMSASLVTEGVWEGPESERDLKQLQPTSSSPQLYIGPRPRPSEGFESERPSQTLVWVPRITQDRADKRTSGTPTYVRTAMPFRHGPDTLLPPTLYTRRIARYCCRPFHCCCPAWDYSCLLRPSPRGSRAQGWG